MRNVYLMRFEVSQFVKVQTVVFSVVTSAVDHKPKWLPCSSVFTDLLHQILGLQPFPFTQSLNTGKLPGSVPNQDWLTHLQQLQDSYLHLPTGVFP